MKDCGVAVAMLPGQELGISLVDRHMVNVGTIRGCLIGLVANPVGVSAASVSDVVGGGQARRRLMAAGGAEVP